MIFDFVFNSNHVICLGDTEEFKVKKTRESRKMTKEAKKQLQMQNSTSNDSKPAVVIQQTTTTTTTTTTVVEERIPPKQENNNGELEIKCKRNEFLIDRFEFLLQLFS